MRQKSSNHTIIVDKLKIKTIIGLLESERKTPQKILIKAKFRGDEFIDYAVVCEHFRAKFDEMKFYKVEDSLDFFSQYFKQLYPSLKFFSMKIIKTKIIQNARVGAKLKKYY